MPIQSMTGFGRGEATNDIFNVTAEIKSVNHRFRDLRFKMSSVFNSIELDLKKELQGHFKRGSFDIYVNYKRTEKNSKFDELDEKKIKKFLDRMNKILSNSNGSLNIQPTEFLRNEFLVDEDLSKNDELQKLLKEAFSNALINLKKSRIEEGQQMMEVIFGHKKAYQNFYQKISSRTDEFQKTIGEKLKKKFEEYHIDMKIDEPRFMQELIYYMEKLDVDEEINRISSHLKKLDELMSSEGEVGRQIDFLIQELNRETNTIGSKSSLKETSDSVIQMKVQLEKIREQGLNLE